MAINSIKAAWIGAAAVIGAALITGYLAVGRHSSVAATSSGSNSSAAASAGDYSPVNVQNYFGESTAKEIKPLKERIRDYFRKLNPVIIDRIDAGDSQICVMINSVNMKELIDLKAEGDFAKYLTLVSTGSVIMGGNGNSIGNCINDIFEGTLHGYDLQVTSALKIGTD